MDEQQEKTGAEDPASQKPSGEEIQKSIEAEIREMEKYKWCLGVELRHDPLKDRSLNEIYCEWIDKYAAGFRRDWDKNKNGNNNK